MWAAFFVIGLSIFIAWAWDRNHVRPQSNDDARRDAQAVELKDVEAEYRSNEVKANDMFLGRMLRFRGKVVGIRDDRGTPHVMLSSADTPIVFGAAGEGDIVFSTRQSRDSIGQLKQGDLITVTAKCKGKGFLTVAFEDALIHPEK